MRLKFLSQWQKWSCQDIRPVDRPQFDHHGASQCHPHAELNRWSRDKGRSPALYLYFPSTSIEPHSPAFPTPRWFSCAQFLTTWDDSFTCPFRYLQLDGWVQVQELQRRRKQKLQKKTSLHSVRTEWLSQNTFTPITSITLSPHTHTPLAHSRDFLLGFYLLGLDGCERTLIHGQFLDLQIERTELI
jgi:hypothetical protein